MSVPDYQYQALLDYSNYLIDVINSLPNVDEIKSKPGYKKVYNKFLDTTAKWLRSKVKKLEDKQRK